MCYAINVSKNKEKRIAAIDRVLQRLFAEQDRVGKNIIRLSDERQRLHEAIWNERTGDIGIAELLDNPNRTTKRQRDLLAAWLKPYYLRSSGYYPDTNQSAVQIMLYRKDPDSVLERMAEGMTKLLDILKPLKEQNEEIILFDIFEHTLSQGASYTLAYDLSDKLWKIRANRFDQAMFAKLFDALKCIRDRHYYQKGDRPKEFSADA